MSAVCTWNKCKQQQNLGWLFKVHRVQLLALASTQRETWQECGNWLFHLLVFYKSGDNTENSTPASVHWQSSRCVPLFSPLSGTEMPQEAQVKVYSTSGLLRLEDTRQPEPTSRSHCFLPWLWGSRAEIRPSRVLMMTRDLWTEHKDIITYCGGFPCFSLCTLHWCCPLTLIFPVGASV